MSTEQIEELREDSKKKDLSFESLEYKFDKMYKEVMSTEQAEGAEGSENRRRNRDNWNSHEGRRRPRERSESRPREHRNFDSKNYSNENFEDRNQHRNFGCRDYRDENLPRGRLIAPVVLQLEDRYCKDRWVHRREVTSSGGKLEENELKKVTLLPEGGVSAYVPEVRSRD